MDIAASVARGQKVSTHLVSNCIWLVPNWVQLKEKQVVQQYVIYGVGNAITHGNPYRSRRRTKSRLRKGVCKRVQSNRTVRF
jgi:hypothetical protein